MRDPIRDIGGDAIGGLFDGVGSLARIAQAGADADAELGQVLAPRCIEIRQMRDRDQLQLGIEDAEQQRVFERLYRGTDSEGAGIGLFLVKRICDRLGWTASLQSSALAGSEITIRFRAP